MLGDERRTKGRAMARESFSVATFNLFNLQEPGKPMHQGQTWSDEEFDVKIKWIAWQLGILDADIVGLQELWSKAAIEAVLEVHKPLKDQYDVLAEPATGEDRGERKTSNSERIQRIHRLPRSRWRSTGSPGPSCASRSSFATISPPPKCS